jgi:hypothetical protein
MVFNDFHSFLLVWIMVINIIQHYLNW